MYLYISIGGTFAVCLQWSTFFHSLSSTPTKHSNLTQDTGQYWYGKTLSIHCVHINTFIYLSHHTQTCQSIRVSCFCSFILHIFLASQLSCTVLFNQLNWQSNGSAANSIALEISDIIQYFISLQQKINGKETILYSSLYLWWTDSFFLHDGHCHHQFVQDKHAAVNWIQKEKELIILAPYICVKCKGSVSIPSANNSTYNTKFNSRILVCVK